MTTISTNNSTSVSLTSGNSFTGSIELVSHYSSITVSAYSNVDSAPCGFVISFGVSIIDVFRHSYNYSLIASIPFSATLKIPCKYLQITYTNGSTDATDFFIQTILNPNAAEESTNDEYDIHDIHYDSMERLRTSTIVTIADIKFVNSSLPITMCSKISGGGIDYDANNSTNQLYVTTNNDNVIIQTKRYCIYQPGKSMLVLFTSILNANNNAATTSSMAGYFDDNNGIFFKYSDRVTSVVVRKNGSDNAIAQSQWNIDKMDGTGHSRLNLDFSKGYIYYINFSWFGFGEIKFGVYYAGKLYLIHEHRNINLSSVFIKNANLPMRFQMQSSGGAGKMHAICGSVISEGGYSPRGFPFSYTRTAKALGNVSSEIYIMALRIKATNRIIIKATSLKVMCTTTNANIILRIYLHMADQIDSVNPITGASFVSPNSAYSFAEIDVTGSAYTNTNGILIDSSMITTSVDVNLTDLSRFDSDYELNKNYIGTSDYLVITATSYSQNNESIYTSLNWMEIL